MSDPIDALAEAFPTRWRRPKATRFLLKGYVIDWFPRSDRALIVTFDHMMATSDPGAGKRPGWGRDFLARKGLSALHVKPRANCWYRRPAIAEFFRAFEAAGVARRFGTVMTYGSSMGGFGAMSFARLAGARRCLALNPQMHLGPAVRGWETRFQEALKRDWTGELCDLKAQLAGVETAAIAYDPHFALDRRHVELLDGVDLLHLRLPFVEHNIPYLLTTMRIAETVFDGCLDGTLDETGFRALARRRRGLLRWRNNLIARAAGRARYVEAIEAHTRDAAGIP